MPVLQCSNCGAGHAEGRLAWPGCMPGYLMCCVLRRGGSFPARSHLQQRQVGPHASWHPCQLSVLPAQGPASKSEQEEQEEQEEHVCVCVMHGVLST